MAVSLLTNSLLQIRKSIQYGLMLDQLDNLDETKTISSRVFEKTYGKL